MQRTKELIGRVRTRMALVAAVEDFEFGAAFGAGATLVLIVAARLHAIAVGPWTALGAGAAVAVAFPLVGALMRRRDDRAMAAVADERLGLSERVSTALWWQTTQRADAADFGPLVVADAESSAARVPRAAIARAFRPRARRRPIAFACAFAAACVAAALWNGPASALVETEAEKIVKKADADRVAEVARKIREAAKRVEEAANERKEPLLAKVAAEIHKETAPLTRADVPPREQVMKQLNALADLAKEQARRSAGLTDPIDPQEAQKSDEALEQLLENLSKAGLESLQKDLRDLEARLKKGEKGDKGPSAADVRKMAARLDALRAAMERAAGKNGSESLLRKLRSIGNEAMLAKIAERMRQIAARLDRGESYAGLQGEGESGEMDLSQMSEEDLQKLLDELDQLAGMKDLEKMLRSGGGELAGGRKLRLDGMGGT